MAEIEFRAINKVFADGTRPLRDLDFRVGDGEFMVVVGPSGCGKSTLLRLLAGLEAPSSGEILIDGRIVNDWPAQKRNTAMVFQDYALYPHMKVAENLAFPLRMQGMARAERQRRVAETAAMLGLSDVLHRLPRQLSGGQRQRVAMGRAVIRQPSVFLLDEPLSNVDAKLRVQLRVEIAALQARLGTTILYVTHDQVEASTLGHRVALMRDGVLQQVASPREIYDRPNNVFVASFVGNPGMNLIPVRLDTAAADGEAGALSLPRSLTESSRRACGPVAFVGFRPEALSLTPPGADDLGLAVRIEAVESLGHEQLVYAALPSSTDPSLDHAGELLRDLGLAANRIVARVAPTLQIEIGASCRLSVATRRLTLFGADGQRIDPMMAGVHQARDAASVLA